MFVGTVKWFDAKKGYGFIVGPEGKDVFVHFSVIEGDGFRSLRDGEEVEYDFYQGDKGLLANAVKHTQGDPMVLEKMVRDQVMAQQN